MKKYAVWNNKGGVGKTFLTFVIATEYAQLHPEKHVVVIDMCPQANVSEILLGGNSLGAKNLEEILSNSSLTYRKSIGGYFDSRFSNPDSKTGAETDFVIDVADFAKELPKNLHLVCGDPSLELQVQSINQLASIGLPENRWNNIHRWVIDLQDAISNRWNEQVVFFIDCNPSFATYTAQAIVAASRLIVPCTADGSSARALDNMAQLIYGQGTPKAYAKTNFYSRAKEASLSLPLLHLIALNRATVSRDRPAKAFQAMYDSIKKRAAKLQQNRPDIFTPRIKSFVEMPDAHTVAIVSCYFAKPLKKIAVGSYDLGGQKTQVNPEPLERYIQALDSLVKLI